MTSSLATRRQAPWVVAAAASVAVLYHFPPAESAYFPPCAIHQFTGLLCPGCGGTRALYALLHGHLREAVHLNALLILLVLPTLILYLSISLRRGHLLRVPSFAIGAFGVITLSFTLLRNLPIGAL